MAKFAYPIPNGKVNTEGLTKLISTLYTGSGVIYADSLTVSASGTPDMNVVVSGSQKDDVAVFIGDEGIAYTGWNNADETVAIDANGSGNTMKDTVVAYIDLAAGDTETANAPDGLKFMALRGASTSTAPTDSAIDTAVGHSLWTRLADVSVSSGATSINSGNITDVRTRAVIANNTVPTAAIQDSAVTTAKIADSAVTSAKLAQSFFKGRYQTNTTNSDVSGMTIQMGWGFVVGDGTSGIEKDVTFPTAFTSAPLIFTNFIAARAVADGTPTGPGWFNVGLGTMGGCYADDPTLTGFRVSMTSTGTFSNTVNFGFAWIAIGTI